MQATDLILEAGKFEEHLVLDSSQPELTEMHTGI